jgi:hypothetical protein
MQMHSVETKVGTTTDDKKVPLENVPKKDVVIKSIRRAEK